MSDSCEERVRIPGIIHMEGEEEDTDQVILSSHWSGLLNLMMTVRMEGPAGLHLFDIFG